MSEDKDGPKGKVRRDRIVGHKLNHAAAPVVEITAGDQNVASPQIGPHKPFTEEHHEAKLLVRRSDAEGDTSISLDGVTPLVRRRGYSRP
jgi:hypothetical protein